MIVIVRVIVRVRRDAKPGAQDRVGLERSANRSAGIDKYYSIFFFVNLGFAQGLCGKPDLSKMICIWCRERDKG